MLCGRKAMRAVNAAAPATGDTAAAYAAKGDDEARKLSLRLAELERARRRSLERVVDHLEALVAAADAEPGEDEDASYDGDDGVGD